ncbi:MAG: hypothetical protein ACOYNC_02165 [Bacteroidales bacterium]
MMITIAVADFNKTYCQGLKTLLEQVEGFEVVLLSESDFRPEVITKLSIDILLVDEDIYQACKSGIGDPGSLWPAASTIVLTMDHDVIGFPEREVTVIFKGSDKREFSEMIQKQMLTPQKILR